MARTIDAVYEEGVFKPLVPVECPEGQKVQVYLPYEGKGGPLTPEEVAKMMRRDQEVFAGLSDEEWAALEADILGPDRLAARREKDRNP